MAGRENLKAARKAAGLTQQAIGTKAERKTASMTYLELLNQFNTWLESNALPANSQLLYFKLLNVFNRAGWPKTVQIDNRRLEVMLGGVAATTAIRARDKLVEAGIIRFRKGYKSVPNRYELATEYCGDSKSATESASVNDTENATISATESASICDSESDTKSEKRLQIATISATESASDSATHIKTKTKSKTISPLSPQGETGSFARFWQSYPRKMGKGSARKAWSKLHVDNALLETILGAVERDKLTDQWQRDGGQYIPYPATWLNQQRWEDEPEAGAADPEPDPPEYRYPRPEDDDPIIFKPGMRIEDLL